MKSTTIAIDLAKDVFQIALSKKPGRVDREERVSRTMLLRFFAQQPQATVLLEACGTAHHWARQLRELGHEPILLPASHVAKYRIGNKTDRNDARALLEAHRNEAIQPVPIKSVDQQTVTALHRLRTQWQSDRTARINSLRGVLRELGFFIPQGAAKVRPEVWRLIEDADSGLPEALRAPLAEACLELQELERRVATIDAQLKALAKQMPTAKRLLTIPGVGLIGATALVALVGDAKRFPTGRHFASFLGLTPRERSSGMKRRTGRISKRGDAYLRTLLIHGARSALNAGKRVAEPDGLRTWAIATEKRTNHNKATCALANKIARIVWAVWTTEAVYQPKLAT